MACTPLRLSGFTKIRVELTNGAKSRERRSSLIRRAVRGCGSCTIIQKSKFTRSVAFMSRWCLTYQMGEQATSWISKLLIRLRRQFIVPRPSCGCRGKMACSTGCRTQRRRGGPSRIFVDNVTGAANALRPRTSPIVFRAAHNLSTRVIWSSTIFCLRDALYDHVVL